MINGDNKPIIKEGTYPKTITSSVSMIVIGVIDLIEIDPVTASKLYFLAPVLGVVSAKIWEYISYLFSTYTPAEQRELNKLKKDRKSLEKFLKNMSKKPDYYPEGKKQQIQNEYYETQRAIATFSKR